MKNRLLQLAGGLALIAVLGKFYAVPLMAQVRAALVKNIDEPGRVPYQHGSQCTGNISCADVFPVVPANKRLVVETVSAQFRVIPASSPIEMSALNDGTTENGLIFPPQLYLTPILTADFSINNEAIYSATASVHYFLEPGTTPQITFHALNSNLVIVSATLTGYLIDLTQ